MNTLPFYSFYIRYLKRVEAKPELVTNKLSRRRIVDQNLKMKKKLHDILSHGSFYRGINMARKYNWNFKRLLIAIRNNKMKYIICLRLFCVRQVRYAKSSFMYF